MKKNLNDKNLNDKNLTKFEFMEIYYDAWLNDRLMDLEKQRLKQLKKDKIIDDLLDFIFNFTLFIFALLPLFFLILSLYLYLRLIL